MIKRLLFLLLLFSFSLLKAETIKTDVLVIGGGPGGVAAALQCARSKVKTLLVVQGASLGEFSASEKMYAIETNRNLPSGVWGEFRRMVTDHYKNQKGYDTSYNAILCFEPAVGTEVLNKMTDTIKKLSIKLNTTFTSIKKDGTGWEVGITINNETVLIKTKVVIDATENGDVIKKAGATMPDRFDNSKGNSASDIYRTSIAAGEALPGETFTDANATKSNYPPYPSYCIPMRDVVISYADNLLIIDRALPENKSIQYLPVQMALGQGTGTVAAFCAFFKTTTKHLNVRIIQGELLDYKGYLLPFTDVSPKDPHSRAIQQVCATGLLKGIQNANDNSPEFQFEPNNTVNTEEVKPVLNELYTRAFLWFNKERPGTQFTVGNLLSLISDYTLTDPKTLQIALQKSWASQFKLTGSFDLNRPVTRLEFAVLANRYLNPFAKRVDLSGRVIN